MFQNVEGFLVTFALLSDLMILLFNCDQVLFYPTNIDFLFLVLVDVVGYFVFKIDFFDSVKLYLE